jgi:putative ABC transport system permease protein
VTSGGVHTADLVNLPQEFHQFSVLFWEGVDPLLGDVRFVHGFTLCETAKYWAYSVSMMALKMLHDLRIAVRRLLKSPGFTATALLMLALGIGATTAIFSIVEGVLLRPLPFPRPERLMVLGDILQGSGYSGRGAGVTAPDIRNYIRDTHSFSSLGGYKGTAFELSGIGDPATVNATRMTSGVFPALGVAPLLGRVFTGEEEDQRAPVAVLSYTAWQSRLHGVADVVGKKILLDRKPYSVIGVMPRNFEFPLIPGHLDQSELWLPMSLTPEELTGGATNWSYKMVGRLKPGVAAAYSQDDAEQVAQATMRSYPAYMGSLHIRASVRPLQEEAIQDTRPLIRTLFLAVAVVLLIVCANLAGLLLVRAIRKKKEIAVRLALGATAATLLRQAMLESLALSLTGGLAGLALAAVALRIGVSRLPETLPRINEIGLDWPVVGFALGLALLTGAICGLAPAFAAIRTSVNETLKEGMQTGASSRGHGRLRSGLVIVEIAVAMALLAASGLLLRSFEKMREVDPGFRPDHTLAAAYSLPSKEYATQAAIDGFRDEFLRRLRQEPGVTAAGMTSILPASGAGMRGGFVVQGYVAPKGPGINFAAPTLVAGDYLQAMGISLLRGRLFTDGDAAATQLVVIVNRKLAERYWPGRDPIGKHMRRGVPTMNTPWMTVVGEVDDVKLGAPDEETPLQMYQPVSQGSASYGALASPGDLNGGSCYIAVRTALPPEQMESALLATVRAIDPQLPLTQLQTMEHAITESEAPRRFNTALITAFAAAAVLLAVLGIYSVIAFSVAMRGQEIAIRMALGSQRSGIARLVLLSGAKLAVAGCVIGLLGAIAASRLLGSFLFEVSAFDPLTLGLAAILVLLLALVACLLPARRAASVDPMRALRAE